MFFNTNGLSLEQLADDIREGAGRYIIWAGAGISVAAGIPAATGVVDYFLEHSWLNTADGQEQFEYGRPTVPSWHLSQKEAVLRISRVRKWALQNAPVVVRWKAQHPSEVLLLTPESGPWWKLYSDCWQSLRGDARRQHFLSNILQRGKIPTRAHLGIAALMKARFVKTMLTTNFDHLQNAALYHFNEYPSEFTADSSIHLTSDPQFLQLAYLHGKGLSYHQRQTSSEVKATIPGFQGFLEQSFHEGGLIVVGYRGGDETPMDVLVKVLTARHSGPGRGLYWIVRDQERFEDLPMAVRRILKLKSVYLLRASHADSALSTICSHLNLEVPRPVDSKFDRSNDISELVRSATNLNASGKLEDSIKLCQMALSIDGRYVDAHVQWGIAERFRGHRPGISEIAQRQHLSEAERQFRAAIELDPQAGRAHSDLGMTLVDLGEKIEAKRHFKRAIENGYKRSGYTQLHSLLLDEGNLSEAEQVIRAAADDGIHINFMRRNRGFSD